MGKLKCYLLGAVLGAGIAYFFGAKEPVCVNEKQNTNSKNNEEKFKQNYNLLIKWMNEKNKDVRLEDKLRKNCLNNIAIYGMGEIGTLLFDELKDTDINISYVIDQNNPYVEVPIKTLDEKLPNVDVMVVTVPYAYDCIKEKLEKIYKGKIISVEELIEL